MTLRQAAAGPRQLHKLIGGICLVITLSLSPACAQDTETTQTQTPTPVKKQKNPDPLEFINRPIYLLNGITDKFLLRPAGVVYNFILPRPLRLGVGNFFDNITYPRTIINDILQGKFKQGGADTGRFLMNSTLGVFGLFDVATKAGLNYNYEDFGQTFAVWGVPSGPYIVLPVLGPRTFRSGVGTWFDVQVNPLLRYDNSSVRDKLLILWTIETRAALIGPDQAVYDAFDPYLFVRDTYLQNREFLINDGKLDSPAAEADADFFDDDFDEDF